MILLIIVKILEEFPKEAPGGILQGSLKYLKIFPMESQDEVPKQLLDFF